MNKKIKRALKALDERVTGYRDLKKTTKWFFKTMPVENRYRNIAWKDYEERIPCYFIRNKKYRSDADELSSILISILNNIKNKYKINEYRLVTYRGDYGYRLVVGIYAIVEKTS